MTQAQLNKLKKQYAEKNNDVDLNEVLQQYLSADDPYAWLTEQPFATLRSIKIQLHKQFDIESAYSAEDKHSSAVYVVNKAIQEVLT